MKIMTSMLPRDLVNVKVLLEWQRSRKKVKTGKKLTYVGDKVNTSE